MHGGVSLDIDAWLKQTANDDNRRFRFLKNRLINKRVIDFGCGAGGFIEKAKTVANKVAGIELESALQPSFESRGLNVYSNHHVAYKTNKKWDLLTAFHVVEHLQDPRQIIADLSSLMADAGEMVIEVPSSDDALLTLYECEPFMNFTYWSQHIFLFNRQTLSELARQAGLEVSWIRQIQRYPLSNHLHWLAKGEPGGHEKWNFLGHNTLDVCYENLLASLGLTDTIICGLVRLSTR